MDKCDKSVKCSDRSLKKLQKRKKKRKRHSSTSSDSSSVGTSSSSSSSHKQDKRKSKKYKKKKLKKKMKKLKKLIKDNDVEGRSTNSDDNIIGPAVPNNLAEVEQKTMAPETKEQWEKRQNVIKKVYDEQSGRYRLIKGDGEVLEEIVSKDRHKEINKQATIGDGQFFQSKMQQPRIN